MAFTLTANTDNISGGAGADTISGSSATFDSDDMIDGGAGNDTLNIAAAGAGNVIANTNNVETIKVVNGGAANTNYALNMIGATGATELMSRLSTGEVTFNNVQSAAKVTAYGTQTGSKVTVGFQNTLASGEADSASLKVDGAAAVTFQVSGTDDANEFETINLESAGAAKNTVAGIKDVAGNNTASLKTLNVTGAADLAITLAGGHAKATYDGSTATGAQTVTVGGNFTTIKTGKGNDKIDASAGGFFGASDAKVVNGGDGTDTLVIAEDIANLTSNDADVPHAVSGVEIVEVQAKLADGAALDLTRAYAADKIAGVSTIRVTGENNDGTAGGADGEDVTVNLTGITTEKVQFSYKATATATNDEALSVAMKDSSGATDAVTIESVAASTTQVNSLTTLTVGRDASNNAVETVNLVASAADVTTTVGTTIDAIDAQYSGTLNISGAKNITIGAVELADPANVGTTVNRAVIDASSLTGKLTLGAAGADFKTTDGDEVSVKLGSGTNKVYFGDALITNDMVTGTTGTDTVYYTEKDQASGKVEATVSAIDELVITAVAGTGANDTEVSAKNFSNVGKISVVATNTASEDLVLSNVAAGQAIEVKTSTSGGNAQLVDTLTVSVATGVTAAAVTLKGADGTAQAALALTSNAGSLSITDAIVGTDGYYEDNQVTVAGTAADAKVTKVTLSGGGKSSATATAAFDLRTGAQVNISTVDATALASNLKLDNATLATGAAVKLGSGDNTVTVASAQMARDALVITGGDGADTVAFTAAEATGTPVDLRPGLSSVETVDVTLNSNVATAGDVNLDLRDTSGVATLKVNLNGSDDNLVVSGASGAVALKLAGTQAASTNAVSVAGATTLVVTNTAQVGATAADLTAADATSVTIKQGHSSNTAFDTATFAKATSITIGGSDKDTAGAAYSGTIAAASLVAAELTSLAINSDEGNITLSNLTAAKLASVTVTGDNAVAFGGSATTTTALASFDASAATGNVTIAQGVDFTSSATIKLGGGNDSVTLDILAEGNLAVDGGSSATSTADSDTLLLAGANNMGMTVIDLSAADQVYQLNGGLNAAVQTKFENVDLSGLSGSFGANITGTSGANTLVGSANADNIVAGEGVDSITGGGGIDTIDLTESTAKADTVALTSASTNDRDVITGFDIANDVIALDESAFSAINFANTGAVAALAAGDYNEIAAAGTLSANKVNVITTAAGYADYATAIAAVNAGADGSDGFVLFYNSTSGKTELYWDADMDNGDSGVLIAQVDITGANVASLSNANFSVF